MPFDPVDPRAEAYMRKLASLHDEPVLLEMEQLAKARDFPIVDRLVGEMLEVLALSVSARTVFELGSGFGYSAYWFTRAVGEHGRVICTDGDAGNRDAAERFLLRTGRWPRVEYHVGWAQDVLAQTPGTFDVIYSDVDKSGYPEMWTLARDRVRSGGLYICDNVLWSGRVAEPDPDATTEAILRHNAMVYADPDYDPYIVPTRDGVLVARRR